MVAESNRARRLRRSLRTLRAAVRPLAATALVSALVAAPIVGSVGPSPAAAATPAQEEAAAVAVNIAPTIGTSIDPALPVTIDVEIDNRTGEPLAAGSLRLTKSASPISDQGALDSWLAAPTTEQRERPRAEQLGELPTRGLSAGSSEIVSFTLPAGAIGDGGDAPVAGLGAELVIDDTESVVTTAALAFSTATGSGPRLALAYALTVPAEASGIIDADALELWTGTSGLLTRQLDAVADRPVAIALDPRLIVSIRALGSSAPASAIAWLDRLAAVSNEVFPLAYADADLAVQTQLGIEPLAPVSFADLLDPADFTEPVEGPGGAGSAAAGLFGTAEEDGEEPLETQQPVEPTVPAGEVPTTQQLLAWPYTRTDLAWPADATVAAGDLEAFDDAGYTTTILDAANVEPGSLDANAAATVEGRSTVVADARISSALREAAEARSAVAWGDAAARVGAELAMRADGGGDEVLLATFQRGAGTQSARVAALLDAMTGWTWAAPASLSEAIGAAPAERPLTDSPEPQQRLTDVQRLLDSESEVQQFATVLADPALLTGPVRRQLLALLDVAWLTQPSEWSTEVGERLVAQTETVNSVSIAQSSNINVLSSETGVPTTIENQLPYPVTVFVDVAPSNGRLIVEERVETTVAADSRSNVIVPVAAGVGNGEVTLSVSLWSADGVKVGQTVQISANVQADWEGLGALILGIVVVLVFGLGIWRNIRRRRREKATGGGEAISD